MIDVPVTATDSPRCFDTEHEIIIMSGTREVAPQVLNGRAQWDVSRRLARLGFGQVATIIALVYHYRPSFPIDVLPRKHYLLYSECFRPNQFYPLCTGHDCRLKHDWQYDFGAVTAGHKD
jgi:hypothetical protein